MTSYKMVYGDEDNMVTETYANIDSVVREDGWLVLFRGPEAVVRVELRDGEVAEHEPDRVGVAVEQQVHVPEGTPAVRALVIAILQDGDWCVGRPAYVVVRGHLRCGKLHPGS